MATKKKIDIPELLGRLKTLEFNVDLFHADLKKEIEHVQDLFGLDPVALKANAKKISETLSGLEHWINTGYMSKLDYFRKEKTRIKRIGKLN